MPPQLPEIARAELLRRLAEGGPGELAVLTPNTRLATALAGEFDRLQMDARRPSWETADVLPFGAFVARLWDDMLHSPRGAAMPILLMPVQEQAAWDEAVRAGPAHDRVFSTSAAATQAHAAWNLLHAWHVQLPRGEEPNEDVGQWLNWSARYEKATRERGQTDSARLPDVVARNLDLGTRLPAHVVLAGFDIVTPQMRAFLDALAATGCILYRLQPPSAPGNRVARVELTQYKDEISAAAAWARTRLEESRAAARAPRIGVVVPDLVRSRAHVERAFARAMRPGREIGADSGAMPFDISLGLPLSDYPLVGDALLVLALAGPEIPFAQASRLVLSPFVGGAEAEGEERSRLDARLRELCGPVVRLDSLLKAAAGPRVPRAPLLLDHLASLASTRKALLFGAKNAADWARAFSEALRAFGFPGGRTLDSTEHQTLERWHSLLGDFGSLERVGGKMGYADACQRLMRLAGDAVFQPESPEVPIQVMGVLESAGLEFDHLWIMGLTDDAWPLPARANPFLPVRAQRAAGIPQSDPAASLELDRRITQGWLSAAGEVVRSHARLYDESDLAPSPLVAGIAKAPLESLGIVASPSLRDAIRRAGRVESLADANAPPASVGLHRGGTGLFRDQAACPFRGFARRRVASKPLETPRFGLDPRDRGNLLHEMLAEIWRGLETREVLARATPQQLAELLDLCATTAIERVKKKRGEALSGRFERMEHARLLRLARDWIAVELAREDFSVVAIEDKRPMTFGGVMVEARLDRMDVIARGRAVIDYKTGACNVGAWLGDRPEEPQLPMYALASDAEVNAVAFAQVKAGEMGYRGFAREKDAITGLKTIDKSAIHAAKQYRSWDELVAKWREELDKIGRGFALGDARVDPKKGPQTCETCDQHGFCRIAEKGSFGVRKGEGNDE